MKFILKRVFENESGTWGVIANASKRGYIPFALTLERRWLQNAENVSCVPYGTYEAELYYSNKFNMWTYRLIDVPGRSGILLHKGNFDLDSQGCILLGEMFEPIDGKPALQRSGKAFDEFMGLTAEAQRINIEIKDYTR
jgi:hypothetical protein